MNTPCSPCKPVHHPSASTFRVFTLAKVHGDLRPPGWGGNVIFNGDQAFVLDFEWAWGLSSTVLPSVAWRHFGPSPGREVRGRRRRRRADPPTDPERFLPGRECGVPSLCQVPRPPRTPMPGKNILLDRDINCVLGWLRVHFLKSSQDQKLGDVEENLLSRGLVVPGCSGCCGRLAPVDNPWC